MAAPGDSKAASSSPPATRAAASSTAGRKLSVNDFDMLGLLGQGSYAKVMLGRLKSTGKDYALKIVEKELVQRYNKVHEMMQEKKALSTLRHPGVVKLKSTFQDPSSLYFVLELAPRGELFSFIHKHTKLPLNVGRFYAAELVSILEYLHRKGVVHRDLKPENVLITADGHIKLTDFATSKDVSAIAAAEPGARRKSFVGTAEYVSPEVLGDQPVTTSADIWALGCIVYQMLVGQPPFKGESEYLTFQKILARELSFPPGLDDADAKDLIERLLVLDPTQRLGATVEGYAELKAHPFFAGIDWTTLHKAPAPPIELPELVQISLEKSKKKSRAKASEFDDTDSDSDYGETDRADRKTETAPPVPKSTPDDIWKRFLLDTEHIVFRGLVSKRRGIFAKRRQLILTDFPRMIYVNPENMELRGEIQWSQELWAEMENPQVFWIHTPKRDYYMKGLSCGAKSWTDAINGLKQKLQQQGHS